LYRVTYRVTYRDTFIFYSGRGTGRYQKI